ncbi:MAG TPA: hypothetical protein ENN43_04365 [bacterium]|nr:hypothetical protein [bacterium]
MKKGFVVFLVLAGFGLVLLSCGKKDEPASPSSDGCSYAFGYNLNDDNMDWQGNYLAGNDFTMSGDMVIKRLSLKAANAGKIAMAIYADNGSGVPGALIAETGVINGRAGWNHAAIPEAALENGSKYWLIAISQNTSVMTSRTAAGIVGVFKSYLWDDVEAFGIPSDIGGWTGYDNEMKIYASVCD